MMQNRSINSKSGSFGSEMIIFAGFAEKSTVWDHEESTRSRLEIHGLGLRSIPQTDESLNINERRQMFFLAFKA